MKRILFFFFFLFLLHISSFADELGSLPIAPYLPAQAQQATEQTAPITVQYPYENLTLPRGATQIFIFGQVNLELPATLDINGQEVKLHHNGAFVAFVPVETGDFTLTLTAKNGDTTAQAVRHVKVRGTDIKDFSQEASFDQSQVFPQRAVELLPGDTINLYVRGTPGAEVTAQLPAFKNGKDIELKEERSVPGTYRGTFIIEKDQKPKTSKVVYKMKDGPDNSKDKITAPAKITVRDGEDPFTYAQVNSPGVKLRKRPTASGNLYSDYRAYGVVRTNGKMADQSRLWIDGKQIAWLENKHLTPLKNYEEVPNVLSFIRTETSDDRTRFAFTLTQPVPLQIHEDKDRVELTLHYVDEFEQNFSLDDTSPLVSNIQWVERGEKTIAFRILLRKKAKLWGYSYRFEENQLVLDLMHEPARKKQAGKPLAGARIVLDAGHSPKRTPPYDGAVGPTGYLEYEATMALAEDLKPLLEQAGATVLLTREGDNKMSLQDRYDYAKSQQAHIFISLHYNALSETQDPLAKPRGFTVYYAYPHSLALADKVYKSFVKHVPLADNGLLANDVLFIPRMPDYPSILVENAFLILPEQEEMAKTKEGRAPFVKALYEGIVNFYKTK